ncbi:MAG: hypothetical protein FWF29_08830, partial [Treponema sp.]|nr:hypothetical protein [Treponema sp.]
YFDPNTFLAMKNGKVVFVADTEEFRDGLRYVARLVQEGLLDRISFTQNVDQARQLVRDPQAVRVGVFTDLHWGSLAGERKDTQDSRADSYIALAPLEGPKGIRFAQITTNGIGPAYANITDNCKDPVLAFRWLEGMYNEEVTKNIKLGLKGIMYNDPDPGARGINHQPALYKAIENPNLPEISPYQIPMFIGNQYSDFRLGKQVNWDDPDIMNDSDVKIYYETLEKYDPYRPAPGEYVPLILHHTIAEAEDISRLEGQIKTYVRENIAAFAAGTKNIDRDWDAYAAEFKRLELPLYLRIKQTAYDRQYGARE